jgi:hypothetical protein
MMKNTLTFIKESLAAVPQQMVVTGAIGRRTALSAGQPGPERHN